MFFKRFFIYDKPIKLNSFLVSRHSQKIANAHLSIYLSIFQPSNTDNTCLGFVHKSRTICFVRTYMQVNMCVVVMYLWWWIVWSIDFMQIWGGIVIYLFWVICISLFIFPVCSFIFCLMCTTESFFVCINMCSVCVVYV